MIMTFEVGRRVGENASHGTDHETAAPHFIMGGRVKVVYTSEYRSLPGTVIEKWWRLPPVTFGRGRHPAIDCLS
jgi:uncharacterized protein (DUF1501 family)